MGIYFIIIGIIGVIGSGILTNVMYKKHNPLAQSARVEPVPGSGDIPKWVSFIYLIFFSLGIIGLIMLVWSFLT